MMRWNNKSIKPLLFLIIMITMSISISSCTYFATGKNLNSKSVISNLSPTVTTAPTTTTTASPTPTNAPTLTPTPTITPIPTPVRIIKSVLKIGDYILMGKYYDEPILWRCIDIDKNGPLMLSDRIIMIKAFDAGGIHKHADGTLQADSNGVRTKYGSNLWDTSNLRAWLNSTASAGKVTWPDGCPPINEKLRDDTHSEYAAEYANEKGFLANGNFTSSERKVLKSVTQKVMINGDDEAKLADGGSEHFNFEGFDARDRALIDAVQNSDTAYYNNVTDKIFILDIKQMYDLSLKTASLGKNYHIGKPTKKMVENSKYTSKGFLSSDNYWCNWLRTPYPTSSSISWVWITGSPGLLSTLSELRINGPGDAKGSAGVFADSANDFYVGVRPAFYINLTTGTFTDGYGNLVSPYIVRK